MDSIESGGELGTGEGTGVTGETSCLFMSGDWVTSEERGFPGSDGPFSINLGGVEVAAHSSPRIVGGAPGEDR